MKTIKITERKCSANLQKGIKVGNVYVLQEYDTTKDGTQVAVVLKEKKTIRINRNRFSWEEKEIVVKSYEELMKEKTLGELKKLTIREQEELALIPFIYNSIAWFYAQSCREWAARTKVAKTKKLSRAYDYIRSEYNEREKQGVCYEERKELEKLVDNFIKNNEISTLLLQLELNVRNEIFRHGGSCSEVQIYSHMAALMVKWSEKYRKETAQKYQGKVTRMRLQTSDDMMDRLLSVCYAYGSQISEFDFFKQELNITMQVLVNKINSIEFNYRKK